jgi:hypothetical protein
MNEAALQIILEFSVHLHYMYSLTNSYGKWFGFAPRKRKIQQFIRMFCVQYSAISETERFIKCSDVLPICRSDDSSNKIKISVK